MDIYETLNQIANLPDNWNNNSAKAFSDNLIIRIYNIIKILKPKPMIFPTANDNIQLEYEKDNGDYLEFELFENGKCKMFCNISNKPEYKFINDTDITIELSKFYD